MKKKLLFAAIMVMAVLCLAGCSIRYASHYSALMLVTTNTSSHARIDFSSFDGTKSFRLNCKTPGTLLKYSGKLDDGSVTVSIDTDGTERELFSLSSKQETASTTALSAKGPVYIIVRSNGKCKGGSFSFELQ